MLLLSGIVDSIESARTLVESKISSGDALELLRKNIGCQGGDESVCDDPEKLLASGTHVHEVKAAASGYISAIDTLAIGNTLSSIGGGRVRAEDEIDHAIGYECVARLGDQVSAGDTIGILTCRNELQGERAGTKIATAHVLSETRSELPPLVHAVIS
jgi:thymidine phosphorylase